MHRQSWNDNHVITQCLIFKSDYDKGSDILCPLHKTTGNRILKNDREKKRLYTQDRGHLEPRDSASQETDETYFDSEVYSIENMKK